MERSLAAECHTAIPDTFFVSEASANAQPWLHTAATVAASWAEYGAALRIQFILIDRCNVS